MKERDRDHMLHASLAVERGIACPVPGCSGDQCVLCEGEMRLPLGDETDRALAVLTGNMQRQYDELYVRMSGYLEQAEARAERAEAKVRAVERLHVWTNEDGRRFVFADDLAVALEIPGAVP